MRVYIAGMGIISPVGKGIAQTKDSIIKGSQGIRPLSLFPVFHKQPLPVGEISESLEACHLPRTHQLSLIAAEEAMKDCCDSPDAIVMGITTGGMLTTEELLKKGDRNPESYQYHSPSSVAEYIACKYKCAGPVITVSTACSSGAAAVKVALGILRAGRAEKVLAGGADSLCRLTYYGFSSLQLIDPAGSHPLDRDRRGMSVAEGAAMLLLAADDKAPDCAVAEILGAGLSCDAYHGAAPHPDGEGALRAMLAAIKDAGISPADTDYISLHGTGTLDNDLSEARALNTLFPGKKPCLSSVKGATGHSLAGAGTIEAVISAIGISEGLVPGNVGCDVPDPELSLDPVLTTAEADMQIVLSNSFGFGGNNASLVIGSAEKKRHPGAIKKIPYLTVVGSACITGAGDTENTLKNMSEGRTCKGMFSTSEISQDLPSGSVRRLKRLPRMALSLAVAAHKNSKLSDTPSSVFFGTGQGPLSETYDFLARLFESDEQFSSPTDFVGSVHNAPGAQAAILMKATGPNITTTGGDYSFEQSLLTAGLLANDTDGTMLIIGADESHDVLSPLFDRSALSDQTRSDGGGALCLKQAEMPAGPGIFPLFFENAQNNPNIILSLVQSLGGPEVVSEKFGLVLVGIPGGFRETGENQLLEFLSVTGFDKPVIDYRKYTGEFVSASAVATVIAV